MKAPSSSAWAHFGFRSWDLQCSCGILGLHSSGQFRPPLLLTVIPHFLDVSVFLPVGFTALQNPFIMNWLRRYPARSRTHPQPHKYREPGRLRQPTLTWNRSISRRPISAPHAAAPANPSKHTLLGPTSAACFPRHSGGFPRHARKVRPAFPKSLMSSNWLRSPVA